jgi:protein-disulfide isomerase
MAGAAVVRRRALAAYVIAAAVCFPAFWLVAGAAVSSSLAQSLAQPSTAEPFPPPASPSPAQPDAIEAIVRNYLNKHPDEIEQIVKDYIVRHPEVLREAITGLVKSRNSANADKSAEVRSNAAALFNSTHQVTLGNPEGDLTVVEFFDYNCGYCKRALGDMLELMKSDWRLRIVLKELPVLGRGSAEAAQVAVAVRMQDASGGKYLAFHRRLLEGRGPSDKASALAVAGEMGLDLAQLERDMTSEEARATIEESTRLARALGINGTPSYVIGENVVIGAVGIAALKSTVQLMRQ